MPNPQEVLEEYREKMTAKKEEVQELRNDRKRSDEYKNEQKAKKIEEAKEIQEDYREEYEEALQSQIESVKSTVSDSSLPDQVANLDKLNEVTKTEIEVLAEKFQDNYFAQKKLAEIARKNEIMAETFEVDAEEEIKELRQKLSHAGDHFSKNPLKDYSGANLREAFKLDV